MADELSLGTIVTTVQGLKGVVRFRGTTSFSPGKWIGIELYEKNGKNDGAVQGVKYFNCQMGYGIFVKPSTIKDVHGSELDTVVCAICISVHLFSISVYVETDSTAPDCWSSTDAEYQWSATNWIFEGLS